MDLALYYAKIAQQENEVPVGCVIIKEGKLIGYGYNTREKDNHVFSHAEINAIKMASEHLGSWRLENCELYVTLEPCIMCAGAITQARIKRVYFGAYDLKGGAYGSVTDLTSMTNLNHYPEVYGGISQAACELILKEFFEHKRQKKQADSCYNKDHKEQ